MSSIVHSAFITLIALALTQQAASQNLIINPGFENGLNGWSQVNEGSGSATMATDNAVYYSGSACGKVTLLANDALGGFAQNVQLESGASYEVRCRCKSGGLNGIALPYLNINNAEMLLEYGIIPISGTTDWYEATARFVSPSEATNATFFLFVQGSGGTAYFDDVTFTKISNLGNAAFTLDLQNTVGTIRPYMDVNAGPINPPFSQNLSADFQELGITSVRTHDFYGPCDIHSIFPDFNADVNDPASYQFELSDQVIAAIVATGAEVVFRLGESYNVESLYNSPPSDNQKMAEICKNIVRHYNDNWNNGFSYGIEKWEIWNEADLFQFWSGSALEYTTMYGVIANTLKSYNPNLKIIGPAVSSMVNEWFVDEFLAGVSQFNYPLDGFSYHMYYMANPYGFVLMDEKVDQKLAQYGLEDVPHYLTEWNNYSYSPNGTTEIWRNDPFSAASTAASLIYLQETELVQAHRYRANEFYFGMFDDFSAITYSGLAYHQFSTFAQHPFQLATSGGDALGFAFLAGRDAAGESIQLSVANNSAANSSYSVELENIANNEIYNYTISRIDSTYSNQQIASGTLTPSNATLIIDCAPPFVDKILLDRQIIENIDESRSDILLSLMPNPTSNSLTLTAKNAQNSQAQAWVVDLTGKVVIHDRFAFTSNRHSIDVQHLSSGEYVLILKQDDKVTSHKWVKQ